MTRRAAGSLLPDGCYVKYLSEKGPLKEHFKMEKRVANSVLAQY
jgi:hypothetical protein